MAKKKRKIKEELRRIINEGKIDPNTVYEVLLKIPEFKSLGMDAQGEAYMEIMKVLEKYL